MERVVLRRGNPRRKLLCLRNVEKQSRVCKQDQTHGRVALAALFRLCILLRRLEKPAPRMTVRLSRDEKNSFQPKDLSWLDTSSRPVWRRTKGCLPKLCSGFGRHAKKDLKRVA
ncbi:hypothetical protein F3P66_10285 [Agrobacterium fabrum]|uniref:Uncharacterized protein n=1 Tax=Agrobacterium fabrum (strain C58 / ATCC 33970) TaxID=176299 RepID=Q8UH61_AGRFC|nr:hypothetical protein Atu0824 [Agrobacterium fabrum str. C58]QRM59788.1 hypothetical protein F3P66_10285 [Agrobacterium fabrum]TRB31219.1 hypothetical protein EXN51_03430 [Agrobacterium fabrum]